MKTWARNEIQMQVLLQDTIRTYPSIFEVGIYIRVWKFHNKDARESFPYEVRQGTRHHVFFHVCERTRFLAALVDTRSY